MNNNNDKLKWNECTVSKIQLMDKPVLHLGSPGGSLTHLLSFLLRCGHTAQFHVNNGHAFCCRFFSQLYVFLNISVFSFCLFLNFT